MVTYYNYRCYAPVVTSFPFSHPFFLPSNLIPITFLYDIPPLEDTHIWAFS